MPFQIRNILVQIRIISLTNGSRSDPDPILYPAQDQDPALLVSDLQYANKNNFLCAYYFLMLYLHHSSQIKNHKEVIEHQKSRVFLLLMHVDGKIRIREAKKLTDLDLEQWLLHIYVGRPLFLYFLSMTLKCWWTVKFKAFIE
jgi:hypothetical protein